MSQALLALGAAPDDIAALTDEQRHSLEKMSMLLGKSALFLLERTAHAMRNPCQDEPQQTVRDIVRRPPTPGPAIRPRVDAPKALYRRPDDGTLADITWLQMTLRSVPFMRTANLTGFAQRRFTRGVVRACMAALLSQVHGNVVSPQAYLFGAACKLAAGEAQDVRRSEHFYPQSVWGKEAFVFAGVDHLWPKG